MSKKTILLLSCLIILFSSCNSKGCYDNMEVKVYCNFYRSSDKVAVDLDSLSVWGVGSDSLVYNNENLGQLALDLNPKKGETQYIIQAVQNGHTFIDTLSFYHTNQPWFQSMECGCMVFSTLDSCKTIGSIIQSTAILNPKINNEKMENVIFYL